MITLMEESKKHKQYSIVKFSPPGMTDTIVIQFYGGAFKLKEKQRYAEWLMSNHHQDIVEVELDAAWSKCQEVRVKDKFIDITTCSRKYYKYLQSMGEIE